MKLNLGCGNDIRNDYLNIDVGQVNLPPNIFRSGDVTNLDWVAQDNSVDEILALNILQYIELPKVDSTFINWTQKLKVGGSVKILVNDLYAYADMFVNKQMPIQQLVMTLFGSQENQFLIKKNSIDRHTLINKLIKMGFNIDNIKYENGLDLYVEATKERVVNV